METTLVRLIPLKKKHALDLYFNVKSNDNVFRNLLWNTPQSVLDYVAIVKQLKKHTSFAVINKDTNAIVAQHHTLIILWKTAQQRLGVHSILNPYGELTLIPIQSI